MCCKIHVLIAETLKPFAVNSSHDARSRPDVKSMEQQSAFREQMKFSCSGPPASAATERRPGILSKFVVKMLTTSTKNAASTPSMRPNQRCRAPEEAILAYNRLASSGPRSQIQRLH
jgi:hypothetical protein